MRALLRSPLRFAHVFLAAAVLAGLFPAGLAARASAAATGCTKYRLIAARGSGDLQTVDDGLGAPGKQMKDQLSSLLGSDFSWSAVNYPAVAVDPKNPDDFFNLAGSVLGLKPLGAYTDSVRKGTKDTQQQLESYHRSCPSARFILGGYSQGAQAVGDALQRMPQADGNLVAAAGFFGDPYFNARSWSAQGTFSADYFGSLGVRPEWPSRLNGYIFSRCHDEDPVCNISQKVHLLGTTVDLYVRNPKRLVWPNHFDYATKGDGTTAADEIAQALGYPLTTSPLDVVFAIDSTGSMGGAIGTVQDGVNQLASTLATATSNFRFALVDYKDEPAQDSAYQARVDLGFTTNLGAFQNSVNSLTADGGGDTPESVYDGVMTAFSLPWRTGASHAVVLIGDAPAKDPEPLTGFTLQTVADASTRSNSNVFAIQVGSDPSNASSFSDIARVTDGQFFPSGFASSSLRRSLPNTKALSAKSAASVAPRAASGLLGQLEAALLAAAKKAHAVLGGPYHAFAGVAVAVSGGASTSTAGTIVSYGWDFDGNGTVDQTTNAPTATHVYRTPGTFTLKLTVHTGSGATSSTSTTVDVAAPPAAALPPIALGALGGHRQVQLSWKNGGGSPTEYAIVDKSGSSVTVVADPHGDPPPSVTIDGLQDGLTYRFAVAALNSAGGSALASFPPATTDAAPAASTTTGTVVSQSAGSGAQALPAHALPATGANRTLWNASTASGLLVFGLLCSLLAGHGLRRRGGIDIRHRRRYRYARKRLETREASRRAPPRATA